MKTYRKSQHLFIVLVFVFFISACSHSSEDVKKHVTLEVVEDTISPTGLTLMFNNSSFKSYIYGEGYTLMQEISGRWINVPMVTDEPYVILIAHVLQILSHREVIIDWEQWYGSLNSGNYHIGITVTSNSDSNVKDVVTADFEISESD